MAKTKQVLTPPVALIADETSRLHVPLRLKPAKLQPELVEGERREYAVQFVKAGRVRTRDGGEANWEIPAATLREAVALLAERPVFIDHADGGWFGPDTPSMKDLLAVTFDPTWNNANESIDGAIRLYNRPDLEWMRLLLDEILEDEEAGREMPGIGGSMVFFGRHDWVDIGEEPGEEFLRVTTEITYVESWDIVFSPGADGRIKEILSSVGISPKNISGGRPMKFCTECGSKLEAGECPKGHDLTPQTQLATASAGGGQQQQAQGNNAQSSQNSQQGQGSAQPQNGGQPQQNGGQRQQAQANDGDGEGEGQGQAGPPPASRQPAQSTGPAQGEQAGDGDVTILPAPNQADFAQLNANVQQLYQMVVGDMAGQVSEVVEALNQQGQRQAVQRMGYAPNDQQITTIAQQRTALERFEPVVNWLFGVEGSPTPDREFRRADDIYAALTGDWDFHGIFQPGLVKLAGASPVTLPNLAVNAMNKVVATQFSRLRYYRWYELVAVVVPNNGSLHDMQWITYGGTGNLPVISDGGPYTEGELADSRETNSFETRGRYVGITRKMIKNSDIQRIQAVPMALATDAVRTRSAKIAGIFTQNSGVGPTLSDGNALFHASRNNVLTTAFGTDTTAWEAASNECFGHTELGSGKAIATFAKYALLPKDLYFQGLKNFGYGDGNPTTYNPFAVEDRSPEDPRPVVLPVPDWTDANDWAYLADPMIWPVIMMSYSQNPAGNRHPMPELFAVTSELAGLMFTNDSLPIKVRDEWAAGVNGGRGIGKRNVT